MPDLVLPEGMKERWNPGFDFDLTWYLSGPMSGYPGFNYDAFEDACRVLRATGVTVLSPHENEWPKNHLGMPQEELWENMMTLAFKQMQQCQGIILLRGWPQSRGAVIELGKFTQHKQPVWYYHDYQLTNMNKEV